jgi:hypothetical protein
LHSLVDSELLSQGEVLEDERTLAFEEGSETSGLWWLLSPSAF